MLEFRDFVWWNLERWMVFWFDRLPNRYLWMAITIKSLAITWGPFSSHDFASKHEFFILWWDPQFKEHICSFTSTIHFLVPFSTHSLPFFADIIFLIYLYQRWIYPVDRKRVNEFGFGGEDEDSSSAITDRDATNDADVSADRVNEKKTNWEDNQAGWKWFQQTSPSCNCKISSRMFSFPWGFYYHLHTDYLMRCFISVSSRPSLPRGINFMAEFIWGWVLSCMVFVRWFFIRLYNYR